MWPRSFISPLGVREEVGSVSKGFVDELPNFSVAFTCGLPMSSLVAMFAASGIDACQGSKTEDQMTTAFRGALSIRGLYFTLRCDTEQIARQGFFLCGASVRRVWTEAVLSLAWSAAVPRVSEDATSYWLCTSYLAKNERHPRAFCQSSRWPSMNQIKVSAPCYLVQSPNTYIGIRRPPSTSISRLYPSFDVTV